MSIKERNNRRDIFTLAWQFVKRNGMRMSEALRIAWINIKLRIAMQSRIVKFWFTKVDGTIRESYGTLRESLLPATKGSGRKTNDTVSVYFDTEKQEWRSFKKANLIKMI